MASFAERLLEQGFNSRFHVIEAPFRSLRTDAPADAPATDPNGGDGGDAGGSGDGTAGSKSLRLDGLAVPFESPTRIVDWFDGTFDEQFRAGSFLDTIANDSQVMLFDHGMHPMFGDIPIADITSLGEQKDGLRVQADMFDNWMTQPLQDAIRSGLMRMSIMFRPLSQIIEERDGDVPLVTVTSAELRELGPVTFPAYRDTWIGFRSSVQEAADRARRLHPARPDGGARTGQTVNRLAQAKARYWKAVL